MPASETLSSRRFDTIVGDFATSEVRLPSPAVEVLQEALGPQTGSTICDVACGAGDLALSFADAYPARLVGVDPAPSMLESFRKLAAERQVRVETALADAEELPFPDASFDLVVSRLAPLRFLDAPKAIGEMTRLLRPGGRLAVIDPEGHEDPVVNALDHEPAVLRGPTRRRTRTLDEWAHLLRGAGLDVRVARVRRAQSRTPVRTCLVIGVKPLGGVT